MNSNGGGGALFSPEVEGPDWAEFEADGFSKPVTGAVYRDGSAEPGMPLGGLGTGYIALGTDATLDYYSTIFNAYLERHHLSDAKAPGGYFVRHRSEIPSMKLPFLGISVGDEAAVLSLKPVEGVEVATQVHYWGHYPVADVEFESPAPVSVGLRAWAPFVPGDSVGSNTPGAVFEVRLRNPTQAEQRGTLAFSFHGPRHEEMAFNAHGLGHVFAGRAESRRRPVHGGLEGVEVDTRWEGMDYGYALGASGVRGARVGGELVGPDWNDIASSLPVPEPTDSGSSIAVDFSLAPGESRTVTFVLSWYAPVWRARGRYEATNPMGMNDYSHMYATRFESALEVAEYLDRRRGPLLGRILAWQAEVYAEKGLPGWLQDSLVNVFAVLPQQSFWSRSLDPGHWWGAEGLFCVNESILSCPQQSCIANDEFGEWPVDLFFPELAANKLRAFKYYQRPGGQTPSTLGTGTEPDQPWYDQQLTIDGQVYVHMVDRLWQATGDRSLVEEFYESLKAGVSFMMSVDADGDGLPDVKGNNQYYDQWSAMAGAAVHVGGYWLATLRIAERMAGETGDDAFAETCRTWYERGSRSLEETLWNESTGSYLLYHQPATGIKSDSVLSDQLIGEHFARLHGLPPIFPEDRVKKVLDTIWRINVESTPFGVRVAMLPDGSEDTEAFFSTCVQPSYSSHVPAALLAYTGKRELGEEIMRRVWRRLVVDLKMSWDMPGGLDPDGEHRWGLEYYHNTMLWTLPVALLGQDLRTFCAPGGLANRIIAAARE